jgi:hypothetical protein
MPINEEMKLLSKRIASFKRWPLPKTCSANAVEVLSFYHLSKFNMHEVNN